MKFIVSLKRMVGNAAQYVYYVSSKDKFVGTLVSIVLFVKLLFVLHHFKMVLQTTPVLKSGIQLKI